jgi:hypothetical protein
MSPTELRELAIAHRHAIWGRVGPMGVKLSDLPAPGNAANPSLNRTPAGGLLAARRSPVSLLRSRRKVKNA